MNIRCPAFKKTDLLYKGIKGKDTRKKKKNQRIGFV